MTELPDFLLNSTNLLRTAGLAMGVLALYSYLRRTRQLRIVTVIDGDTVMAVNQRGKHLKLRIKGVDCPELGQRMSFEAKEFVESLVLGKWVSVKFYGKDKYKRHLARVSVGGKDLSKELLRNGLGFPIEGGGMSLAALGARAARKGVWAGFGQAKPWESNSRTSGLLGLFNKSKKFRRSRSDRLEREHKRRKK